MSEKKIDLSNPVTVEIQEKREKELSSLTVERIVIVPRNKQVVVHLNELPGRRVLYYGSSYDNSVEKGFLPDILSDIQAKVESGALYTVQEVNNLNNPITNPPLGNPAEIGEPFTPIGG